MKKSVALVLVLCIVLAAGCASAQFKLSVFKASKYDTVEDDTGCKYISPKEGNCVVMMNATGSTVIMMLPSVCVLADGNATIQMNLICQATIGTLPTSADDVLKQLVLTVGDVACAFSGFEARKGGSEDKLTETLSLRMGADGLALLGASAKDADTPVTLRLVRASGEETVNVNDSAKEMLTALYKAFVKAGGLKQSAEAMAAVELAATKTEMLP